jgi:hypothetical protein
MLDGVKGRDSGVVILRNACLRAGALIDATGGMWMGAQQALEAAHGIALGAL